MGSENDWDAIIRQMREDASPKSADRAELGYGTRVPESTKRARHHERSGKIEQSVLYIPPKRDCPEGQCAWTRVHDTSPPLFACTKCPRQHVCNNKCLSIVATREAWVCTISGLEKDGLVDNGNFDPNRHTSVVSAFDEICRPSKQQRRAPSDWLADSKSESARCTSLSMAIMVLRKLLQGNARYALVSGKIKKAHASASKIAHRAVFSTQPNTPVSICIIAQKSLAEIERCGGFIAETVKLETPIDSYASICANYYNKYVISNKDAFSAVSGRPKYEHCFLSIYYIMRDGMLDTNGNVAIAIADELREHLPDLKTLNKLGFDISKYTAARRFIQQIIRANE